MTQAESPDPDLAGTGRHMTASELRVWTCFLDAGRILETVLERQLADDFDMSHRDYEVLVRLDGAGGALRMSTLARQIEASAPLVTQTVDRLEKRGWVQRRPAEADGRGVEAVLSPAGRAALAEAAGPHADVIDRLLLDPIRRTSGLAAVGDALAEVADHLRAHRAGEACADPQCPLGANP